MLARTHSGSHNDPACILEGCDNVFFHNQGNHFPNKYFTGHSPPFVLKVIDALRVSLGDTYDHIDFYLSNVLPMQQYGPMSLNKRKLNICFFFGDEKCGKWDLKCFDLVFRQYSYGAATNTHPLPLSGFVSRKSADCPIDVLKRPTALFFSGNLNAHRVALYFAMAGIPYVDKSFTINRLMARILRTRMPKRVAGFWDNSFILFTKGFSKGLPPDQYLEHIETSKITLCPPGFVTGETIRHYEAACAGSVVVTPRLPHNELLDSAPFYYIDGWSDLKTSIQNLLNDATLLEHHQKQGYNWWVEHCSVKGCSDFIAQKIRCKLRSR